MKKEWKQMSSDTDKKLNKSIVADNKKHEMAEKMKKGKSYKKEIDNKKPFAKKDSERFEENGGMSGNKK